MRVLIAFLRAVNVSVTRAVHFTVWSALQCFSGGLMRPPPAPAEPDAGPPQLRFAAPSGR